MVQTTYDDMNYSSIELVAEDVPEDLVITTKYARVSLLADRIWAGQVPAGCRMVDRTLAVRIPLNDRIDFQKMVRMEIHAADKTPETTGTIRRIALRSFRQDFRFRTECPGENETTYGQLIDHWLDNHGTLFACSYKGQIIGFASVTFQEDRAIPFVYLAAVDGKYRRTGAALSLYAYICDYYKNRGLRALAGRISSSNMAVMNLYITLGGRFSDPWDIYLKTQEDKGNDDGGITAD